MTVEQARSRVWFLPCLLLLLLGAGVRWLLLTPHASRLRELVGTYGYSDIATFYGEHHLAQHPLPYLDLQLEYPVLTGLTIWITSFENRMSLKSMSDVCNPCTN